MTTGSSRDTLSALWSPLLAITTSHGNRTNGQIAISGLSASLLPDAPRILVELWKANLTHDMVLASRVFAAHLLPASPQALDASLALVHTLGMRSGRDGDKMAGVPTRLGVTGSPILLDALTYVEAQVIATLDAEEMTVFLADVVAGERLREGEALTMRLARERMPSQWRGEWEASQERQIIEARNRRGVPR